MYCSQFFFTLTGFFFKGIRLSVWETKDINMGGTNQTNINYSIIGNVKFIDTMKHYLTRLGRLASTMTEKKKNNAELLVKQFLMQHQLVNIKSNPEN